MSKKLKIIFSYLSPVWFRALLMQAPLAKAI